jgi:hypothetical protein
MLITASDEKNRLKDNMDSLVSSYNVYTDEYGNELEQLENKSSLL